LKSFQWESAAADRDGIVDGSHSHKGDISLPNFSHFSAL
jgi:hypothetical protein